MTALRYGCRGTRATFRNKGVCERPPLVKTGRRPSVLRGGIKFRFDYRAQVATSETLPPRKGSLMETRRNVGQMRGRGRHSRPARNSWPSFKPDCLSPAGHKVLVLALRKARHWMLGARLNPAVRVRRASRGTAAAWTLAAGAQQNRTFPGIGVRWHPDIPTVIANGNN